MAETASTLLAPGDASGVPRPARSTLDGTALEVDVVASGLTPGRTRPFHLHGFVDDRPERPAVFADDADGDGFVETAEGEALRPGHRRPHRFRRRPVRPGGLARLPGGRGGRDAPTRTARP